MTATTNKEFNKYTFAYKEVLTLFNETIKEKLKSGTPKEEIKKFITEKLDLMNPSLCFPCYPPVSKKFIYARTQLRYDENKMKVYATDVWIDNSSKAPKVILMSGYNLKYRIQYKLCNLNISMRNLYKLHRNLSCMLFMWLVLAVRKIKTLVRPQMPALVYIIVDKDSLK